MLRRSYADVVTTNANRKTSSSRANIQARQPAAERLSTMSFIFSKPVRLRPATPSASSCPKLTPAHDPIYGTPMDRGLGRSAQPS